MTRKAITIALILAAISPARAEIASTYGGRDGLCGSRTASGERYNCSAMTAAMLSTRGRPIPFGTWVKVTHGGRSVAVRITDRGPYSRGRAIDLSVAAGKRIGCGGVCEVQLEVVGKPYQPERGFARGTF